MRRDSETLPHHGRPRPYAASFLEVKKMTHNKEKTGVEDRRDFLKKAALSVAVAGTAAVASKTASADDALDVTGSGYRETDHVKAFYNSARF
jgi:hypothetical protein